MQRFKKVQQYGVALLVSEDTQLNVYFEKILSNINKWMLEGKIQKLVCVIQDLKSNQPIERWNFNILIEDENSENPKALKNLPEREQKVQIHKAIGALMRQIAASVSYLPVLNEPCGFELLVYGDQTLQVPQKFSETDGLYIPKSKMEEVPLRSFTTRIHRIDPKVQFRVFEDQEMYNDYAN